MRLEIFLDTLRKLVRNIVNKIKNSRKYLIGLSLSFSAFLLLMVVIFFSNSSVSVTKEANILVDKISQRKYTQTYEYYQNLQKEFSTSKMKKFNEVTSKKLSTLMVSNAERYINGEISKEQFVGFISTINALDDISIDVSQLLSQVARVEQMYIDENINYERTNSYIDMVSNLNGVNQSLDKYKNNIETIHQSREIYREGSKFQQIKKYKEAIENYNKVVKEDEKYYTLASNKKEECIKSMYQYYIDLSNDESDNGNYTKALSYIEYLKNFYPNDKEIVTLEDDLKKKISTYMLSSNDILALISEKSKIEPNLLSVISYQQIINGTVYYYAEISKDSEVINEVLINAKDKKIYSYKSDVVDYDCEYSDGFYKIDNNGTYSFAITREQAVSSVKNKLQNEKYNDLSIKSKEEILKYLDENVLNKFLDNSRNQYYYILVERGWFSLKKEVYLVDIYNKNIFKFEDNNIKEV